MTSTTITITNNADGSTSISFGGFGPVYLNDERVEVPTAPSTPPPSPPLKTPFERELEDFYRFLDNRRDSLKVQHKGYLLQLQKDFNEQYKVDKNIHWIRKYLARWRTERGLPLEYQDNKYYNSERKRARITAMKGNDEQS